MSRRIIACCSAVAVLASGGLAQAAPSKLSITWNAPEQVCPSSAHVARDTLQLVERDAGASRQIQATATVNQTEDGSWRVEIVTEVDGHKGTRTLHAPTCGELADATSLIIALVIDPQTKRRSRPPPIRDAFAEGPSHEQKAAHPSRVGIGFELSGIADSGTLPAAAIGLQAAGRWHLGPATLEAHGAWWPGSSATMYGRPTLSGEFDLVAFGMMGCFGTARLGVAACLGPELDRLSGQARGVTNAPKETSTWIGALGVLRAEVPLNSRLSISLQVGAIVPLQRHEFVIEGAGLLHRPATVAARAGLGLSLEL